MELTKPNFQSTPNISSGPGGVTTHPRVSESRAGGYVRGGYPSTTDDVKKDKHEGYLRAEIRDGHGVIIDGPKRDRDTLIRSIKEVLSTLSTDKTSGASNPKLLFLQDVCRIFKLPTTIGSNSILNESIVTEELEHSPILARLGSSLATGGDRPVKDKPNKRSIGEDTENRTSADASTKRKSDLKLGANLVRKQSIPAVSNPLKSEHVDPNSIFYSTEPIISTTDEPGKDKGNQLAKPKPREIGSRTDNVQVKSSPDSVKNGDSDQTEKRNSANRDPAQNEMSPDNNESLIEEQVEEFTEH